MNECVTGKVATIADYFDVINANQLKTREALYRLRAWMFAVEPNPEEKNEPRAECMESKLARQLQLTTEIKALATGILERMGN